jgi:hypothetical protein
MACETAVGAPVTVTVAANSGVWLDTGVTALAGECLRITAIGSTVRFGVNADQCAYPEGFYSGVGDPCAVNVYDPSAVLATGGGDPPDAYIAVDQPPYCLLAKITATVPIGTHLTGTLRPNRDTLFSAASVGAGGRVWLILNDNIFADNSGAWTVTLQRLRTYVDPLLGTGAVVSASGAAWSPMDASVFSALHIAFPHGYQIGLDLATAPLLFSTLFRSVRVQGPYRSYLDGTVLHVVDDAGELASGTPLAGVDILRIGT